MATVPAARAARSLADRVAVHAHGRFRLDHLERRPASAGRGVGFDLGPPCGLGGVDVFVHEAHELRLQVLDKSVGGRCLFRDHD